jgi:tRNA pseudouridine13 synthase
MRLNPEDFVVEEVLREEPGKAGDFAVYRATKRMMTTPELQAAVARELQVPPRAVVFPGLKDKRAVTTQHFAVHGRGPSRIAGPGFEAQFVGRTDHRLGPRDLLGNRFTATLRGQGLGAAEFIATRLGEIAIEGLPNYFDEQRFGSYTPGETFFGKAVLQRDAEGALRAYMAQDAPGDPAEAQAFKAAARNHWGDWETLLQQVPRSNYRSILTFLKQHPQDFRRAVNLITPGLLPLLLAAYQSFLWNRVASGVVERRTAEAGLKVYRVEIAGERLAVYRGLHEAVGEGLRGVAVPLPEHRAAFGDGDVAEVATAVLAQEGLKLEDMKARLLKRAYLTRSNRPLVVVPTEVGATEEGDGERLVARFFLPPGSYGTLVLKVLDQGLYPLS